jgi:hypothetical protein
LESNVDEFLNRFRDRKKEKEMFKKRFLENSIKSMLKGSKKKNLISTVGMLKNAKEIEEMINQIKELSKDESNCKEENELVNKAKTILVDLKTQFPGLKLLSILEKEMMKYGNKTSEKIIDEFVKIFGLIFRKTLKFSSENSPFEANSPIKARSVGNLAVSPSFTMMLPPSVTFDDPPNLSLQEKSFVRIFLKIAKRLKFSIMIRIKFL